MNKKPIKSIHHLVFIRSHTKWESEYRYLMKVEILVLGDITGFKYLQQCLRNAINRNKIISIILGENFENSMNVFILPPMLRKNGPCISLSERFCAYHKNMELIISGNSLGYEKFSNTLTGLMNKQFGPMQDHIHLNNWFDPWIVPESVALNIRGCVKLWNKKKLTSFISEENKVRVPQDVIAFDKRKCIPPELHVTV